MKEITCSSDRLKLTSGAVKGFIISPERLPITWGKKRNSGLARLVSGVGKVASYGVVVVLFGGGPQNGD